jgi:regulation of enolase protein 1 (concanavalin A-like superfamily)
MALGALVIGETTVQPLVKSQFQRIYDKAGLELSVFTDEQDAMQWLEGKGFKG